MNLRRFEDERRIFAAEKENFEREKRQAEQMRFQRLLEFERKRAMHQREREIREQLAVEAAAIALAEIEKQRLAHRRSKSKSRERYADDYESSTATSSSSRDDDFNDQDFSNEIPYINEDIKDESLPPIELNGTAVPTIVEPIANGVAEQSLFSRFLFGKPKEQPPKKSYLKIRVDDGAPVSFRRIVFVESPLVWQQVIELHYSEWQKMMCLRNRCIANLILLVMLIGFGGMTFRFVEGTFESFYKCGVRRVKRDFVDLLWTSSRDMRFIISIWNSSTSFTFCFMRVFSEDDWKSLTRSKLRGFEEELHVAHEAGQRSYSGLTAWTFVNGVIYCMTVVTTIGDSSTISILPLTAASQINLCQIIEKLLWIVSNLLEIQMIINELTNAFN